MGLEKLRPTNVQTPQGTWAFWEAGTADKDRERPVIVLLAGSFMTLDEMAAIADGASGDARVVLAELPLRSANATLAPSVMRLAEGLSHALHAAFARRPIVLVGYQDAALVALVAWTPEIAHWVIVDPPVQLGQDAAVQEAIQRRMGFELDGDIRAYLREVFGIDVAGHQRRDHRLAVQRRRMTLTAVVDPRDRSADAQRLPNMVDPADRDWLAKLPDAKLALVQDQAAAGVAGLHETAWICARQAARAGFARSLAGHVVAHMLAKASPRNRREVRYSGPSLEAFQQAYLSHSPAATVRANRHAGPADLLVLQDCDPAKLNAAMLDELMPGAVVIASTRLGRQADDVERAFTDGGFAILPSDLVLAPAGKALVRAQKSPAAGISRVEIYPYARLLMDIRTRLPADALRTEPGLAIHYVSPPFVRYADWIGQPRVVILQRPGGQKPHQWQQFAAAGLQAKEVLIIEFDDHPELIAQILGRPAPDAGAWEMFRVAHAIQTSTDELVELFQQYNPEVRAFPNAAFDIVPFPSRRPPRRVFYGGVTRGPFVADIARALKPAIDAHPDVEFVVIGDRAFFDALPTDRKTFHNYAIYEHYLELMAGCSVSLSPLQDRPMIETKSDAKYIDASRAGVLTIASPPVYDRTIRSGENGFIARTIEDWPAMLAMVLGDEVLRQRIARTAWEDVRDHRMFAHQAAARSAWYADLLARREALDAGIIARSPEVGQFLTQLRNRG